MMQPLFGLKIDYENKDKLDPKLIKAIEADRRLNALKTAVPDEFTLTFFDNTPKKLDDVGSFGTRLTHSNPKIDKYLKALIKEEKVIETGFLPYGREKNGSYTPQGRNGYTPGFDTISFVYSFFEKIASDWRYLSTLNIAGGSMKQNLIEATLKGWEQAVSDIYLETKGMK
jgi:hypothetical protein